MGQADGSRIGRRSVEIFASKSESSFIRRILRGKEKKRMEEKMRQKREEEGKVKERKSREREREKRRKRKRRKSMLIN